MVVNTIYASPTENDTFNKNTFKTTLSTFKIEDKIVEKSFLIFIQCFRAIVFVASKIVKFVIYVF